MIENVKRCLSEREELLMFYRVTKGKGMCDAFEICTQAKIW